MQKNWYAVYTRPNCEKKVVASLSKRKLKNFCPFNCKKITDSKRGKLFYEPLFNSYVFVNIEERDILLLKQIENVVNLVYWKGKPAIIKDDEIEAIKSFTNEFLDIRLEKAKINTMVESKKPCVYLPSLGFTMIGKMKVETAKEPQILFVNQQLILQS